MLSTLFSSKIQTTSPYQLLWRKWTPPQPDPVQSHTSCLRHWNQGLSPCIFKSSVAWHQQHPKTGTTCVHVCRESVWCFIKLWGCAEVMPLQVILCVFVVTIFNEAVNSIPENSVSWSIITKRHPLLLPIHCIMFPSGKHATLPSVLLDFWHLHQHWLLLSGVIRQSAPQQWKKKWKIRRIFENLLFPFRES